MPTDPTTDPTDTTDPEVDAAPEGATTDPGDGDGDTFSRDYVEQLRTEAADHRVRAKRADDLATRLLAATVREATHGVLVDPTDLPTGDHLLDEDGFPDSDAIATAARELVEAKPHLGVARPAGDIGQGARPDAEPMGLAGIMRGLT